MTDNRQALERLEFALKATSILETKLKRVVAVFLKVPTDRLDFFFYHVINNAMMFFAGKAKLIFSIAIQCDVSVDRRASLVRPDR